MNRKLPQNKERKRRYLSYGLDHRGTEADFSSLLEFLDQKLPAVNTLTEARNRETFSAQPDSADTIVCDYCGKQLPGTAYEAMASGLNRCHDCSSAAVQSVGEFEETASQTARLFEELSDMKITGNVSWIMTDSQPEKAVQYILLSASGPVRMPAGAVCRNRDKWQIWVRSGVSCVTVTVVIACALAIIWQQIHWSSSRLADLCAQYSDEKSDVLKESLCQGLALWTVCECLLLNGESDSESALFQKIAESGTADAKALSLYERTYPFRRQIRNLDRTPYIDAVPVSLKILTRMLADPSASAES